MEDRGENARWAKVIRTKIHLGAAFLLTKRHAHALARGEKTSSLHCLLDFWPFYNEAE